MRGFSGLLKGRGLAVAGFGLLTSLVPQNASAQFYYQRPVYQRPVGALPPQVMSEIASEELGLRSVSRLLRNGPVYYIEGITPRGIQMRYVVDAYYGRVLDRTVIRGPARGDAVERRRVAGLGQPDYPGRPPYMDRFDDDEPEPYPVLRPPGRVRDGVNGLAPPPKSASAITRPPVAPAKVLPAIPASLPEKVLPGTGSKPAAPLVTAPAPVPRTLPSAAKVTPEAPKLRLQNPDDLRLPSEPDRTPPMAARAKDSFAPALLDDATPKSTKPPTADVPVTPLD